MFNANGSKKTWFLALCGGLILGGPGCSEMSGDIAGMGGYWGEEGDEGRETDEGELDGQGGEESCNLEDEVVLYLSADDSNSMASPVVARGAIRSGNPVPHGIRTYEFLNYYNFDYEAAAAGHVRVTAELVANQEDAYDLQIGVRAPDLEPEQRRPVNLTLSLDTSGSMSGEPIELVRSSCMALADSLRSGDVISIVTWSSSQEVVLESHAVVGRNDITLISRCLALDSNGSTDLHGGLVRAYQLARENFASSRINRVILMSDGGANTGITDEELIAREANDANGEAIYLMGVGMGSTGYYNDQLMDTVTDKGKGAYVFIDSPEEAYRMLGERFIANVEVAARDVQVELTLPPSFRMKAFHGEEYSEDPDEVEPQHLAPNDAMIFHQVVESCAPEEVDLDDTVRVEATFLTPLARNTRTDKFSATLGELLAARSCHLKKGNAIVAYAEALKRNAGSSYPTDSAAIDDAVEVVDEAIAANPDDTDLAEIKELLESL